MSSALTTVIVTGGSGFLGSHIIKKLDHEFRHSGRLRIINVDCHTYAAAGGTRIEPTALRCQYVRRHLDIADPNTAAALIADYSPTYWIHAAAESHVDRAIDAPDAFVRTNITGTSLLLRAALEGYNKLKSHDEKNKFRFLYVSTDEVYGPCPTGVGESDGDPLGLDLIAMRDGHSTWHPLRPRNPYAASKAAAEHLCMSYYHTYGLPVVITRGCNTYGLYQMPEKFLPLMILKAWRNEPLPLYGDGLQIREWISAEDHAAKIVHRLRDIAGSIHNIGSGERHHNSSIARQITNRLERHPSLITHVKDRPGHDRCYKLATNMSMLKHYLLDVSKPYLFTLIDWYTTGEGAAWCEQFDDSILARKGNA